MSEGNERHQADIAFLKEVTDGQPEATRDAILTSYELVTTDGAALRSFLNEQLTATLGLVHESRVNNERVADAAQEADEALRVQAAEEEPDTVPAREPLVKPTDRIFIVDDTPTDDEYPDEIADMVFTFESASQLPPVRLLRAALHFFSDTRGLPEEGYGVGRATDLAIVLGKAACIAEDSKAAAGLLNVCGELTRWADEAHY